MIFRRPDAFIIKHAKFIHAIIFLCLGYFLFKISDLSTFYHHVTEVKSIIGTSNLSLFNPYMYIVILITIILNLVLIFVLVRKSGKYLFYIISEICLVGTLVFLLLSYSNIEFMQKNDVAPQVYLAFDQLSTIVFYVIGVLVLIYFIKMTGFDIKNFDFGANVLGIDADLDDNEEIEFNFEIDGNNIKTKRKRQLRNFKYLYLENRFKINLVIFIFLIIVGVTIYHIIDNNKEIIYTEGTELRTSSYSIKIDDSYVTNLNYKIVKKDYKNFYLILIAELKSSIDDYSFGSNDLYVTVNDKNYYPLNNDMNDFQDFGVFYKDQKLTEDYKKYYFVYEIPYEFSTKDVYALVRGNRKAYNDYNYYKIKLDYEKISNEVKKNNFKVADEMVINCYGINTKVKISNVEFAKKYRLVKNVNGMEMVEYITPLASDNEEKVIMKINYSQENVDGFKSYKFTELSKIYGSLEVIEGDSKKDVKIYSLLKQDGNDYYIEVSSEVMNYSNVSLKIRIRDYEYLYSLKES